MMIRLYRPRAAHYSITRPILNQSRSIGGLNRRPYSSITNEGGDRGENGGGTNKRRGIRYVGWLWDLMPGRKSTVTMQQHQRDLNLEPTNPAALVNDFREFEKFKGKLPVKPLPAGTKVGQLTGSTLDGRKVRLDEMLASNKCTLLLFKFRQMGEAHLSGYRAYFEQQSGADNTGVVDVIVTENPMFRGLRWLIDWGNRRQTARRHHSSTIIHYGQITNMRMRLGMRNSLVGWAFLCDQQGRVCWQANGPPGEQELRQLAAKTLELVGDVSTAAKPKQRKPQEITG